MNAPGRAPRQMRAPNSARSFAIPALAALAALGFGLFIGRTTAPEVVTIKTAPADVPKEVPRATDPTPPKLDLNPDLDTVKGLAAVAEARQAIITAMDTWHNHCLKIIREAPIGSTGMLDATKRACNDMGDIMTSTLERAMAAAKNAGHKPAVIALSDLSHEMNAALMSKVRSLRDELIARGFAK